jgi:alpha 1,3-mannosyltransferase
MVVVFLFVLYFIFRSHNAQTLFPGVLGVDAVSKIQHTLSDAPSLSVTQWGERGIIVRKLAQWADLLINDPSLERKPFQDTLQSYFPFLTNTEKTIYTPWSSTVVSSSDVGFVICAGSNNFHLAAHLIATLRQVHHSTVPIEIAYAGDGDLKPQHRSFLKDLQTQVSLINLLDRFPDAHDDLVDSGWAMKPFALLASTHKRAILFDADAIFLTSPDSLFDTNPGLARTGTLFFHDRAAVGGGSERRDWVGNQIAAAGIQPSGFLRNESLFYSGAAWYEADSGVIALDKTRPSVLLGLIFATWMNTRRVRDEVSNLVFYGDKETFWVAMELSRVEYFFQPWYAGTIGTITQEIQSGVDLAKNKFEICGTHMLHLDHLGQTPFWFNGGIYEHKDNPSNGYSQLTHYWVGETTEVRLTQPEWYWVNGNIGCLRESGIRVLPATITFTIERIQAEAARVDRLVAYTQS